MNRYIITETCLSCGVCVSECPVDAISEGTPCTVDVAKCVDCGAFDEACPVDAIYCKM
nr:4Fe-4S binding protein [Methanolobus psychrotolerans]